jgi:RimJ/RimL family protein N-acetyltransferase
MAESRCRGEDGRPAPGRLTNVPATRLLTPNDWRVLRSARLQALSDSPHAFTSRYAVELAWSERQWRQRFDCGTWVVAIDRSHVVGVLGLIRPPQPHEAWYLESIWVAPAHRHRGVLRSLLGAVAEIGRRVGLSHLLLWVLEDNVVARRAYARVGFVPTGKRQPVGLGQARFERLLLLPI